MAIKIKSTKDVHANGIKVVLYGQSGTGKTVMASTAPSPIIISAEKGLLSLAGQDLPYIEVKSIEDIGEAYKYCVGADYETIIIDSLSEITETVLTQFKKTMIAESSSGKIDARQAYGKIAESIGALIRNFRDIEGKNVVFIAKERRMEDEESGIVTFEPYMPGKVLPFNLPYLVDEVFCLMIGKKDERIVQTNADRKRPCKDRSGKLDAKEPADFSAIFNKIKEK
ncbi:MAG: AAA family ATPase [Chloroflexota bacterium]|nr:MAG: AAA family ATPase [Chloroflexota bacterium]